MARIMIAWELGGGLGHLLPLAPIVRRLRKNGHSIIAAVKDLSRIEVIFGGLDATYLQAPVCVARSSANIDPPRSFAHILHNSGFADPQELRAMAHAWRSLFRLVEPDLVVFDHAPTALLAAQGQPARQAAVGTGFCCPPDVSPFPDFRPWMGDAADDLRIDEHRLLDNTNQVLALWDQEPLQRLSQLYGGVDHTFLNTFAELDHYPNRGKADYYGAWTTPGGAQPQWPEAPGKRIFAYLKRFQTLPQLLDAVQQTGCPTLIYIDRLDDNLRIRFESPTVRFAPTRLDLSAVGAQCDLAILNGGHGATAAMLLAGTPTMQVPLNLEQAYNGSAVAQLEAGFGALPENPQDFSLVLNMLLDDARFTAGAKQFAARYADFDPETQMQRIGDRLEQLATATCMRSPCDAAS